MGAKKSKKALNSEELIYVMKQTNLDATTINDWYGGFISDCPTGKMTPSHFSHMYKMLIPRNVLIFCFLLYQNEVNSELYFISSFKM